MADLPEAESIAGLDDADRRAFLEELRASGVLDRFYEDFQKRRAPAIGAGTSEPASEPVENPASVAGIERRLSVVETRVGQFDTRLAVVETKIEIFGSQIEKLDARLAAVEDKLGLLVNRVGQVESKLAAIETRLAALEARLVTLDAKMDASASELRNQARTDFRLLFGALIAVALGLAGLMAKGFHWI